MPALGCEGRGIRKKFAMRTEIKVGDSLSNPLKDGALYGTAPHCQYPPNGPQPPPSGGSRLSVASLPVVAHPTHSVCRRRLLSPLGHAWWHSGSHSGLWQGLRGCGADTAAGVQGYHGEEEGELRAGLLVWPAAPCRGRKGPFPAGSSGFSYLDETGGLLRRVSLMSCNGPSRHAQPPTDCLPQNFRNGAPGICQRSSVA